MIKTAFIFLLLFQMSCSTSPIIIHNKLPLHKTKLLETKEEWHHIGAMNLATFSPAVDLKARCPNGWEKVVIEKTTGNFFAGFLLLIPGLFIYSPWNVKYQCRS